MAQPHKGPRKPTLVRPPEEHIKEYARRADSLGYRNLSDYLVAQLAEAHRLPVPAWATPRHDSPEQPRDAEWQVGA